MCDVQWNPLAELYLYTSDYTEDLYCLCSRVIARSREETSVAILNEDECSASENSCADDVTDETLINDYKHENDPEAVSCYCSASYTDNISTDEHDSLRDSHSTTTRSNIYRGLQSSDSGADLTEPVRSDLDTAFLKYWADHGELIIWNSWISKYSDYIKPEYLGKDEDTVKTTKFSFDKKDIEKVEPNLTIIDEDKELRADADSAKADAVAQRNKVLVRNLSGSDSYDKLHADISEGWNPLSPLSIDCETEAERLLSSRCGSYASSSIRTVDSMTNVTRMTVSSIDLSESSKSSVSFSSVSSVQSSLSSSSSDDLDADETSDQETQWKLLWAKHYEEEYLDAYNKFAALLYQESEELQPVPITAAVSPRSITQSMKGLGLERRNSTNSSIEESETNSKKSSRKRRAAKKSVDSVTLAPNNSRLDGQVEIEVTSNDIKRRSVSSDDYVENADELAAMKLLGLPVAFKTSQHSNKNKELQEGSRGIETGQERITAFFKLCGIIMEEDSNENYQGKVDYKMKHIRLQNKQLNLHNYAKLKPKQHIFFDDDGNVTKDSEAESSQDGEVSKDSKQPIPEEETTPVAIVPIKQVDPNFTLGGSSRKKRKRKLSIPAVIKDNPKLIKYWHKRFSLFSKFDEGIKLDQESWYSVTPETVAKHIAERCACDVIVDAFCGAGGNSIQFASHCKKVIAIDIDPKKIEIARNNAEVYGVANRIEFIVADFFGIASSLKANVVFLSPPWGGPEYLSSSSYNLETMLQPAPVSKLLEVSRTITEDVALFLPRNSNTYALMQASGSGGVIEIEQNFLNKKQIAITVFYNGLVKKV